MTNLEIEDVLSSIRRLVSEEGPSPRPKAKPLMLTPALRVAVSSEPSPESAEDVAAEAVEPVAEPAPEPEVAEPEPTEVSADASEPDEADTDEAPVAFAEDLTEPADVAPGQDDLRGETLADADAAGRANADAAADSTASDAAPVSDATPVSDDAEEAEVEAAVDAWEEALDAEEAGDEAAAESRVMAEAEQFFARRDEPSLEERIADLEAAISQSDEEFEPDGSEEQIESIPPTVLRPKQGTAAAEAWDLEVEPPVQDLPKAADAEPKRPASNEDEAPAPREAESRARPDRGMFDEPEVEEALIDEDSLREIVADLVRQELRGELGERITRNVRRMIRREVHRALTLQDLDED